MTTPNANTDPSRNATTHGLTAKRPLHEEEAEHIHFIVQEWTLKYRPETTIEEALVRAAAIEHVRYLRCVAADEAQMRPLSRTALAEWREKRQHAIRRRAQELRLNPADVAADLQDSAFGIDWMVRNWKALLVPLATGAGWTSNDLGLALNLIGLPYQKVATGMLDRQLIPLAAAASPLTVNHQAKPGIADPEAVVALRKFIAGRIAHLEALRPLVWDDVEGPQAAAIESAAMVDTSKEGQLRARYRREALRDSQRSINLLNRLKAERSKMEAREMRMERMMPRPPEPSAYQEAQEYARKRAAEAAAANAESRNEPPPAPESEPDNERKSNPNQPLGPSPSPSLPAASGRTGAPIEAHRGHPNAPATAPDRPSGAPRTAPLTPDRPR